jgi:tRNA threonylcarbamoyladenosine biosynthesis protein TsaB
VSRVLALETATERSSVALCENGVPTTEISLRHGRDLSRVLTTAIQTCAQLSGQDLGSISAVAVSSGPGSFTGLRIGITAAKALAFALSVPAIGIPTLESLALQVTDQPAYTIVPVLDARRHEVFTAQFCSGVDGSLLRISPDVLLPLSEMASYSQASAENGIDESVVFALAGDRVEEIHRILSEIPKARVVRAWPSAASIGFLASCRLQSGQTVDPMELSPVYLRRSYAEEKQENGQ